jgi:hypothetical protein
MNSSKISFCLLLLVVLSVGGCRLAGWRASESQVAGDPAPLATSREGSGVSHGAQAASTANLGPTNSHDGPAQLITPVDTSQAPLDDTVLRELQIVSSADPIAAQQLMNQLQEVKPALRPLVAQQFRASWQYHRELTGQTGTQAALPVASATPPPVTSNPLPPAENTPAEVATPAAPATQPASETPPAEAPAADTAPQSASAESKGNIHPASHVETATATDESAVAESPDSLLAWRDSVDLAIKQLAEASPPDPRSTHEAYQFARLRLLQLVAGDGEGPLEPIPGLTPTEQTYWSNQLFALKTMLDHAAQTDDQNRAALARSQLQEADLKLGELSALSVLNLSFCKEVLAYGNYEPIGNTRFRPGEGVRLYAELENYRSETTDKGYHTSLATSYEVLDKNGNRVAHGEFAIIDDYCLRRRRDFYMEFALDLPARVYASEYQLQILVRDKLSGKLGKASIPFTIAE